MIYQQPLRFRIRRFAALLLLLAFLMTNSVFAQVNTAFYLMPGVESSSLNDGYFDYSSSANKVIEDTVMVVNTGDTPAHLYLYSSDTATANGGGGLDFSTSYGETPTKTGAWINLSESEVTLEPKQQRSVAFTLSIPAGITGEHFVGIVAESAAVSEQQLTESETGGARVNIIQRSAVTIFMNLSETEGEEISFQPQLEMTALEADLSNKYEQAVVAELHNTGNTRVNAQGSLTIRGADGSVVREPMPIELNYFIAGDSMDYRINLDPLDPGEYDATLTLTYEGGTVEQTAHLSVEAEVIPQPTPIPPNTEVIIQSEASIPTWLMVGAGLLIAVVLFQSMILMRSRKG